ncbi:hypothetical protein GW17_00043612 [Ensete ventricosum]|nr:hypothetical protein GW17_00043612 [Ensete ventricosum]
MGGMYRSNRISVRGPPATRRYYLFSECEDVGYVTSSFLCNHPLGSEMLAFCVWKGRVVEIYGPEASGKTTLALHVIAEAQKNGGNVCLGFLQSDMLSSNLFYFTGYCAFIDAEHSLDPALAKVIGVNTDNFLLSQPDCGEQALSLVDTLVRSGSVDVVVVDSVSRKGL